MDKQALKDVLSQYVKLNPNDEVGIEECWAEMADILSKDISGTIDYITNDCTIEEFYWLSSVFENVVKKTQSKDVLAALKDFLPRIKIEDFHQEAFHSEHMKKWIDYETYIKEISEEIEHAESQII